MVQYLLGVLPEPDRAELEARYLQDPPTFDQLEAIEGELIDAWLSGNLPEEERSLFTENYLTTSRGRNRVEFARHAMSATRRIAQGGKTPVPQWPWSFRLAFASVAVLLSAGLVWEYVEIMNLRERLSRAESARQAASKRMAEMQARQQPLAAFLLIPGLSRSEGRGNRISIAPGTDEIQLKVEAGALPSSESYFGVLETADGVQVFSGQLQRTGPVLELRAAARLLPRGDYVLSVRGRRDGRTQTIETYVFRVL